MGLPTFLYWPSWDQTANVRLLQPAVRNICLALNLILSESAPSWTFCHNIPTHAHFFYTSSSFAEKRQNGFQRFQFYNADADVVLDFKPLVQKKWNSGAWRELISTSCQWRKLTLLAALWCHVMHNMRHLVSSRAYLFLELHVAKPVRIISKAQLT